METNLSFNRNEHSDSLRESGTLTDVILVCGEDKKEIPAHKIVLSGTSQYFRTMFSLEYEKYQSGRIELPTIGREEMEIILPFLYKGKCEEVDDISLLKKVLKASHFLQINELIEFYYERLIPKLDNSCFLDIYNLAEEYDDDGVKAQVVAYLAQNFTKIAENEEFLKLSENQIKKVIHLLGKLDFSIESVIKALLRWSEVEAVNKKNREESLVRIVKTLDLQRISTEFVTELLQLGSVKKNHHLLLLFNEKVVVRMLTSGNVVKEVEKTGRDRVKKKSNFWWLIFFLLSVIFALFLPLLFNKESYDFKQTPKKEEKLEQGFSQGRKESYDFKLLVFGKKGNQNMCAYNEVVNNTWSKVKALPFRLDETSLASLGEDIYVFSSLRLIVQYSPKFNTAFHSGTLEHTVDNPSLVVVGKFIYVLSDYGGSLQRCNTLRNTCETLSSKYISGVTTQLFTISDTLYVFVSNIGKHVIERYDAVKNEWTALTNFELRVESPRIASCKDKLFVVPQRPTDEYHVCDFASQTCNVRKFEGAPNKVGHFKAALIKNKCFLLALDDRNVLHKFDVESGQWLDKLNLGTMLQPYDFFVIV